MSLWVRSFSVVFGKHVSADDLTLLASGDLSLRKRWYAARHLAMCSRCALRLQRLDYAIGEVNAYRDFHAEYERPEASQRRDQFLAQLKRLSAERPEIKETSQRKSWSGWALPLMNPILTMALVLAIASVTCVWVWLQQLKPGITSNTLLVRAEAWDPAMSGHVVPGVIRQVVSLKTSQQTLHRTIYRDAQGLRQARAQKLVPAEEQLRVRLATANVGWDTPLSAAAFQDWHDRQRVRVDEIRRSGNHLFVLTTTAPYGDIAAQSLTVRDTDFHPVGRTVSFRDNETVEIAELDYQELPWVSVGTGLFDEANSLASGNLIRPQPSLVLHLPATPSEGQLDEAELGVRLVLNQLHGDTGEQIKVERGTSVVEVKGLVETDQRKRELLDLLRIVPHVKASILSIEELNQKQGAETEITNVKTDWESVQPSPLETYFVRHGRKADVLRNLTQELLDNALAASQESHAITDLMKKFGTETDMTLLSRDTLAALLFSHREKLLRSLDEERKLLYELTDNGENSPRPEAPRGEAEALLATAERNLKLCEELSLGSTSQPREANVIFRDIVETIAELQMAARQTKLHGETSAKAK